MNVYDLKDRVAIVTGGAQGIGLAVANRMLASGARLAIWDRDRALLEETVKRIAKPDRVHGWVIDIADLAAVEAATKATFDHFGKIDILINNAAIVGPNAPTWEYPPEAFRDVVNVGTDRHFLLLPRGRPAHDRGKLRPHRQSRFDRRQGRQSESAGL